MEVNKCHYDKRETVNLMERFQHDASELSYEFESRSKVLIENMWSDDYSKTENAVMPPTFKYVSSF